MKQDQCRKNLVTLFYISTLQDETKMGLNQRKVFGKKVFIFMSPLCRDSGNDFRVPEIGSDNSRFSFIVFLYPHVVPSRFL